MDPIFKAKRMNHDQIFALMNELVKRLGEDWKLSQNGVLWYRDDRFDVEVYWVHGVNELAIHVWGKQNGFRVIESSYTPFNRTCHNVIEDVLERWRSELGD